MALVKIGRATVGGGCKLQSEIEFSGCHQTSQSCARWTGLHGGLYRRVSRPENCALLRYWRNECLRHDRSDITATVATVAVVGIGAAAFEAALLPGIILGVAAMWLPQYFPKMGEAFNPLFRSTVRGAYKLSKKTKEMMADAHEQVHDIVAEVHAEADQDRTSPKSAAASGLPT
jgi:hypothetical protein